MTISAKVIADSISPQDIRLTTMQLRYPKFIHSEFMTHRVFSRNASSSRAIPVERLIRDVEEDPVIPTHWGKNQPGMQATVEMTGGEKAVALDKWLRAKDDAIGSARSMANWGMHKQLVNRIIEPWAHINVVVTSTEWANFFALRRHEMAQPEIRALAEHMHTVMSHSEPNLLNPGQWHLPYIDYADRVELRHYDEETLNEFLIKMSVARCARVSYLTQEGKEPNFADDIKLYDRLVGSKPLHASPAEHQATPDTVFTDGMWTNQEDGQSDTLRAWAHKQEHGNFVGWRQYRKRLKGENVQDR